MCSVLHGKIVGHAKMIIASDVAKNIKEERNWRAEQKKYLKIV